MRWTRRRRATPPPASKRISFVPTKPSATIRARPSSSIRPTYPSGAFSFTERVHGSRRVVTVNQNRPLESASTKFVFPSGCPSSSERRTLVSPVLVMRSIASRPKSAITRSPFGANARPFGSVLPKVKRSAEPESANSVSTCCATSSCVPSAAMRTTPPRASAVQSVPSASARTHSGRWRSRPTNEIASRSTVHPDSGFVIGARGCGSGRRLRPDRPSGRRTG